MKKPVVKIVGGIILAAALAVGGYFAFMTVTDYKPDKIIEIEPRNNSENVLKGDENFRAMIFNIGYAGLDKSMDFFMDGGKKSKAINQDQVLRNIDGIMNQTLKMDADFILMQEVDYKADRSFEVDEMSIIKEDFHEYSNVDAINYKVPWVPVPITDPMGYVKSGLLSLSRYKIDESNRYDLPGKENWPRQLALLDRCFLEMRYKLESGKELVVINTHMSAYDKNGQGKLNQMKFMRKFLTDEYNKGNYIIVGGDWNQELPGTDVDEMNPGIEKVDWITEMKEEFPNFNWGVDTLVPTSRNNDKPYVKGENFIAIIDGFLVSDNIEIKEVKAADIGFENSDHNPVMIDFKLK